MICEKKLVKKNDRGNSDFNGMIRLNQIISFVLLFYTLFSSEKKCFENQFIGIDKIALVVLSGLILLAQVWI